MKQSLSRAGTKKRLIKAAARLFAEHGFDGVSVRDIIRGAGVNLAAVTYHFGGKEQLLEAVLMEKFEPLKRAGTRVAAADLPPREKLSRLLRAFAHELLCNDPDLRILFAESVRKAPAPSKQAMAQMEERNRMLSGIIRDGIADGSFRKCDVEGAVWVFVGILMPYVMHHSAMERVLGRRKLSRAFVDRFVDNALVILFDGLGRGKRG